MDLIILHLQQLLLSSSQSVSFYLGFLGFVLSLAISLLCYGVFLCSSPTPDLHPYCRPSNVPHSSFPTIILHLICYRYIFSLFGLVKNTYLLSELILNIFLLLIKAPYTYRHNFPTDFNITSP